MGSRIWRPSCALLLWLSGALVLAACERDEAEAAVGDDAFITDTSAPEDTPPPDTGPVPALCLELAVSELDFGAREPGSESLLAVNITSCGSEPTRVSPAISGPEGVFQSLPGTLDVPAGATVSLPVFFTPSGQPVSCQGESLVGHDKGRLLLDSPAWPLPKEVALAGFAVDDTCPTYALAQLQEGEQVAVGTTLQLSAVATPHTTPPCQVQSLLWSVTGPDGFDGAFLPSAAVSGPTLTLDRAGTYEISLTATDMGGTAGCAPSTVTVVAAPAR